MGAIALALVVLGGWTKPAEADNGCFYSPDATITVQESPQGYHFGSRVSEDASYAEDCNPYYTVDVTVPGGYSHAYGNDITISGGPGPETTLNQYNCDNAEVRLVIYRRTWSLFVGWSAWTVVSNQDVAGTWVPFVDMGYSPYCQLAAPLRVTAPTRGSAQYRVMVLPKLYGTPLVARVGWHWSY
jgi:hypothetical protein